MRWLLRRCGPSVAFLVFSPDHRRSACRALMFALSPSEARGTYPCSFFLLLPMSKSSSSSHVPWQDSTRLEQGWSGSWKGWNDSSATVSPVQNPEQIFDERVTTALHTMQDHLQQTTVIAQRRSQNLLSERSTSKAKGNAAREAREALTQARERQEEARRLYEQKCEGGRRRGRDNVQRHHQGHP